MLFFIYNTYPGLRKNQEGTILGKEEDDGMDGREKKNKMRDGLTYVMRLTLGLS